MKIEKDLPTFVEQHSPYVQISIYHLMGMEIPQDILKKGFPGDNSTANTFFLNFVGDTQWEREPMISELPERVLQTDLQKALYYGVLRHTEHLEIEEVDSGDIIVHGIKDSIPNDQRPFAEAAGEILNFFLTSPITGFFYSPPFSQALRMRTVANSFKESVKQRKTQGIRERRGQVKN